MERGEINSVPINHNTQFCEIILFYGETPVIWNSFYYIFYAIEISYEQSLEVICQWT